MEQSALSDRALNADLVPFFSDHARMIFKLVDQIRNSPENTKPHHQTLLRRYVLGMSLARLEEKFLEPKFQGRKVSSPSIRKILNNPNFRYDAKMTSLEFKLSSICDHMWFQKVEDTTGIHLDSDTKSSIQTCRLNRAFATWIHQVVSVYHNQAADSLKALCQSVPPKLQKARNPFLRSTDNLDHFRENLNKLHIALSCLNAIVFDLKEPFGLYVSSIKFQVAEEPADLDNHEAMESLCSGSESEDSDLFSRTPEQQAFYRYITGIVRQFQASQVLGSEAQLFRLSWRDVTVLNVGTPDSTMEYWTKTIDRIINTNIQHPEISKLADIASYLELLAGKGSIGFKEEEGGDFKMLPRLIWVNSFKGAVHTEASIAIKKGVHVSQLKEISLQ